MKHSAHITFITGSMTQVYVDAESADHARAILVSRFPAGYVKHIAAWPVYEPRRSREVGRMPIGLNSGFGELVV